MINHIFLKRFKNNTNMSEDNSWEKKFTRSRKCSEISTKLIQYLINDSTLLNEHEVENHNACALFENNLRKIVPERFLAIKNSSSIMTMPFLAKNALLDIAVSSLLSLNR